MNAIELPSPRFDDGRGLYPERITTLVPRGLPEVIRQAAKAEGVSANEFVRRAIAARISMFQYAATLAPEQRGLTMATFIRIRDKQTVPESEATSNGVLRDGYRMLFRDAAPPVVNLKDGAAKRFIDTLPVANATAIHAIIADVEANEVFRVQRAADNARAMGHTLAGMAYSSDPTQRQPLLDGAGYMHALAEHAEHRTGVLYGRSAAGDLTVDAGFDPAARGAAYDKHRAGLSGAWRGDK